MSSRSPFTLRFPLILLALANLAALAIRLRPWTEIPNLPGSGTAGYDPVFCLVAYVGLLFWLGGNRNVKARKALLIADLFGFLAGLLLIAQVTLGMQPATQNAATQIGLLCAAGVFCGIAGLFGARTTGSGVSGMVSGVWSAMVSCLMACAAILAQINLNNPSPLSTDPWKQYEGLAIGNQSIQLLVNSLYMATGFLLIGPLVGGAVGLLFALVAQSKKD
jgi:hypothetical protein